MKSIAVNESIHARIKSLSLKTGMKIYALIFEAIIFLEEKYGIDNNENG